MKEEGLEVDIASIKKGKIKGEHSYEVEANKILKDVNPDDYDILILPGLTLLSTFYIMGWGLGVSSAVSKFTAYVLHIPFPQWVEKNQYFGTYFKEGQPLNDWWVFEVSGMFVGGLIGAITARRFNIKVERGPNINTDRS